MIIDVTYKYSQFGIIAYNFLEERVHCSNADEAINKISVCLRHLKKNGDGAIHVSINKRTLSVMPDDYEDWQNGIVTYWESEGCTSTTKKNIPFSRLKKLFRNWIDANAVAAA